MLPEDTKKRKSVEKQSSVTAHFGLEDREVRPIPYSEKALETATLEWLIETNQVCILSYFLSPLLTCGKLQPIATFKNAAFKKMLDIMSRSNRGIQLPSPKQSRSQIIKMFKHQLCLLRECLSVCICVPGLFCPLMLFLSLVRAPAFMAKSA